MRKFGIVPSMIWTDPGLKQLGFEGIAFASYLLSCPHGNFLHLYHLPIPYAAIDTGLSSERILDLLQSFVEIEFCVYDKASSYVWIESAMVLQNGEILNPRDHKVSGVKKVLSTLQKNPVVDSFLTKFGQSYRVSPQPTEKKAIPSPLEAPLQAEEKRREEKRREEKRERRGKGECERENQEMSESDIERELRAMGVRPRRQPPKTGEAL